MRALTRISIALLLGTFIGGAAWAQATDQNATPSTAAPGPRNPGMMGRHHDGQSGYERMSQQLNLTDQQKTQMQSLMQSQRQQAQAIRQDTALTAEQKKDKLQQLRQSNHQQMMSLLTPDQQQKLQQLRSERKGMGGGMGPAARLNLTPDQKSKLDPIFQSSRQQVQAVRNDSSLTPEQKQAKISEIRQNTQSQINGILTPEQQQQWQRMQQMHKGRRGGKPGPPPAPPSGF